jgi:hypothetical protein
LYGIATFDKNYTVPELVFANPDQFDFTIKPGEKAFAALYGETCVCTGTTYTENTTIKWKASIPKFAPTDKTPARVGITE